MPRAGWKGFRHRAGCFSSATRSVPPRPYWAGHYPRSWQQQTYEAYDRFWDDLGLTWPRAIRQVGGMALPDQYAVEADCVKFCEWAIEHPHFTGAERRRQQPSPGSQAARPEDEFLRLAQDGFWMTEFDGKVAPAGRF